MNIEELEKVLGITINNKCSIESVKKRGTLAKLQSAEPPSIDLKVNPSGDCQVNKQWNNSLTVSQFEDEPHSSQSGNNIQEAFITSDYSSYTEPIPEYIGPLLIKKIFSSSIGDNIESNSQKDFLPP